MWLVRTRSAKPTGQQNIDRPSRLFTTSHLSVNTASAHLVDHRDEARVHARDVDARRRRGSARRPLPVLYTSATRPADYQSRPFGRASRPPHALLESSGGEQRGQKEEGHLVDHRDEAGVHARDINPRRRHSGCGQSRDVRGPAPTRHGGCAAPCAQGWVVSTYRRPTRVNRRTTRVNRRTKRDCSANRRTGQQID